jgi:glycosyltransferase involved in cell wall biosynthesis
VSRLVPSRSRGEGQFRETTRDPEFTILLPCLNEAETIATCIRKARDFLERNGVEGEILVADNGSTDGSQEIARSLDARVIDVPLRGYGAALRAGTAAAAGRFVIMGDADDSYDFSLLEPFVDRLRAGDDLVMGNRFSGHIRPGAMPALHKHLGNPVLTRLGRLFFRAPVGDFHCGLRGYRRDAILDLDLRTTGMEYASEMVVKATLHGLRISEVPIVLHPDGRSRPPHLRSWRDGWRHLRFLLLYTPRWLFLYPGLVLTIVGGILSIVLVRGPVEIGQVRLGVGAHFMAAISAVLGYQAVLLAILSKVYGQLAGYLPEDNGFNRLFRHVRLETGLVAGITMAVAGLVAGVVTLLRWRDRNWGNIDTGEHLRTVVPTALGLVLGAQTIMASFFLSILGIPHSPPRTDALLEVGEGAAPGDGDRSRARPDHVT